MHRVKDGSADHKHAIIQSGAYGTCLEQVSKGIYLT